MRVSWRVGRKAEQNAPEFKSSIQQVSDQSSMEFVVELNTDPLTH